MSVPFVTRAQWGARAPTGRQPWAWGDVLGLAVHWPGGNTPDDHASCDNVVRGEQANQMDTRGYRDIAYNALICKHGYVYEGRWLNDESGANGTAQANQTYFAVTFLVGLTEEPTQVMYDAFAWIRSVVLGKQPHATSVQPHSHFVQDQCPGDRLRAAIAAGTLTEDVMTDAQMAELKKYIDERIDDAVAAIAVGTTVSGAPWEKSASWVNTIVGANNIKAVLDRAAASASGSGATPADIAKAVADELDRRLAG